LSAAVTIIDWRPKRQNSLLGFAKVEFASGMIVSDVTILTGNNGPWASPPSKPQVSRDGTVMKDASGKVRYSPVIEFRSKEIRDRFSAQIIDALRDAHPEAFQ
jgi:DNA-binding cell septation regulator SpoVG